MMIYLIFFHFTFDVTSSFAKTKQVAVVTKPTTTVVPQSAASKKTEKTSPSITPPTEDTPLSLETFLDLRDPFRQFVSKTVVEVESKKIPELERYETDQIKLIGMISGLKKNKALLATPGGKMHIATENEHIGTRHGVIKKIVPSGVYIEEKVINLLGQEEKVQTVLQFKEKPKEGLRWVNQ